MIELIRYLLHHPRINELEEQIKELKLEAKKLKFELEQKRAWHERGIKSRERQSAWLWNIYGENKKLRRLYYAMKERSQNRHSDIQRLRSRLEQKENTDARL